MCLKPIILDDKDDNGRGSTGEFEKSFGGQEQNIVLGRAGTLQPLPLFYFVFLSVFVPIFVPLFLSVFVSVFVYV